MLCAAATPTPQPTPVGGSGDRSPSPDPGGWGAQQPSWSKPADEDNVGNIEMWAANEVIALAKVYLDGAINLEPE